MSDRDFLDLDDDLLDDGPDAPVGEWDDDLMGGFPEDDPAAGDAGAAAPSAIAAAQAAGSDKKKKKKAKKKSKSRSGGSGGGVGFLCFLLVLLAGLTLSAGLMTATGAAPEALLDFSGFSDPMAIGDFTAHPINAFWLSAAIALLAAIMAAVAVDKRVGGAGSGSPAGDEILEAVRQLDPENPATWENESLQVDPDVAAVTSGLLGHVNLQQAKLERYVGLEGELHRLEKAMADDNLDDLQGNWENPSTGSLADQAVRLVQARNEQGSDASSQAEMLTSQGPDLVSGLRDARSWQGATVDQVKLQGAGVERVFRRLSKLAEDAPETNDLAPRRDRLRHAIEAVRQELSSLPARAGDRGGDDGAFGTLIERASRLAFQIAMEVARLGAKGERLLPLTQDLEELTTELRAMVDRDKTQPGEDDPRDKALANVRGRLAELDPDVLQGDDGSAYSAAIKELAPQAGEVAAGLANLAKNFGGQDHRLKNLVELASAITGIEVPDTVDGGGTEGNGMLVDRFDPFASSNQPEGGLVADPFAGASGGSIFEPGGSEGGDGFARTVLPGQEEDLVAGADPEPQPSVEPVNEALNELTLDPGPAAPPVPQPEAPVDSPLPLSDEKVYDLSDFDAQPVTGDQPAADPHQVSEPAEERIYDLSEFGAVRIE